MKLPAKTLIATAALAGSALVLTPGEGCACTPPSDVIEATIESVERADGTTPDLAPYAGAEARVIGEGSHGLELELWSPDGGELLYLQLTSAGGGS